MVFKICTGCKNNLPINNYTWKYKSKDIRETKCKNCRSSLHKEWFKKTKQKRLDLKESKLTNRQCKRCKQDFKPKDNRQRYCSYSCCQNYKRYQYTCINCKRKIGSVRPKLNNKYKCIKCATWEYHQKKNKPKYITPNGYKIIRVYEENCSYRIFEHRYIVEQHLKRKLVKGEIVHHINYDKSDNRLENLEVMTQKQHRKLHGNVNFLIKDLIKKDFVYFDKSSLEYKLKEKIKNE